MLAAVVICKPGVTVPVTVMVMLLLSALLLVTQARLDVSPQLITSPSASEAVV